MAYPDPYARNYNFQQDANNGVSDFPQPGKVDTELNDIATTIAQLRARLMTITSADGRLRNVAYALAQSLVGTWSGTSDGTTTIDTDIPWQATFSTESMLVMVGTTMLRPAQISSVSSNSGNLRIVLVSAPAVGTTLVTWAFEPGDNVLTILASAATGDGAARVAIEDAGGLYIAADVEAALAEIRTAFDTLVTDLGPLANYFLADGSVVATDDFDMNGNKITGAADGSADGDYVTVRQIAAYVAAWNDLALFFLKRDGTAAMSGDLNFGSHKGTNLGDADLTTPTDAVNVRTLQAAIASGGASPVGTVAAYIGTSAPTNWLICDGTAYDEDDYPALAAILPSAYRQGYAQGAKVATFPALVSGNLTAGVLTSLPALTEPGVGYLGIPEIEVRNTDGGAAVATQPTFNVSVSSVTLDGPNVTGGVLTITLATGGSGIRAGAVIIVKNSLASNPGDNALAELPSGYFRVPDMRGRVALGAGTESKTPGITDPPDLTKGDGYNASSNTAGDYGGEEKHVLTVAELARHNHDIRLYDETGASTSIADGDLSGFSGTVTTEVAGSDTAHNTRPPFHVLTYIVKAR